MMQTKLLVSICLDVVGKLYLSGFAVTKMSQREDQLILCYNFANNANAVFAFCKCLNHTKIHFAQILCSGTEYEIQDTFPREMNSWIYLEFFFSPF